MKSAVCKARTRRAKRIPYQVTVERHEESITPKKVPARIVYSERALEKAIGESVKALIRNPLRYRDSKNTMCPYIATTGCDYSLDGRYRSLIQGCRARMPATPWYIGTYRRYRRTNRRPPSNRRTNKRKKRASETRPASLNYKPVDAT